MESHILNMYHQARYRTIGHKIMRSTSESLSSESSCNQNSPEYSQSQQANQYDEESNEGEYWDAQGTNERQEWSQSQTVNITQGQDSSSDDEEQIDVQEVFPQKADDVDQMEVVEADCMEDNSLVEGDDYDIIQVFAVDPDLDLEASSEDEKENDDYCIADNASASDSSDSDDEEYHSVDNKHSFVNITENNYKYSVTQSSDVLHDGLGLNLDAPVVSNVDEYFIKNNDEKHILEVKDEPVVNDVDEYFIKHPKDDLKPPHIEDFLENTKPLELHADFRIQKDIPNVEEFFAVENLKTENQQESQDDEDPHDVSINESDLEVLPNIEDLKRYLLDDMPYTKLKNSQKSCSVPHSPMHNLLDIDAKTCLSFENLNLDLSDLAFDNDKDKTGSTVKSDDIPRTLTDEDVNSFLITNNPVSKDLKNEDDFSHQDMEIERPVDSIIDNIEPKPLLIVPEPARTSTPIPKPTVLEFCIEKPSAKKEPELKVEPDDFVDVESCNDTVIPVLEANNLNSLLEQFEATEKLNTKAKTPAANIIEPKVKSYNSLTNGMRLQDAGVQLNKTKMRQILMQPTVNTAIRRSPSPVYSDHDYCSSKKRHSLPNIKRGQSLLKPEVLSSNNRILNSRHRSCKNKKIVYHLSSDEESEKVDNVKRNKIMNNRVGDDNDVKIRKSSVKQSVRPAVKKYSPARNVTNDSCIDKSNDSVIVKRAYKASDTSCSQNSNGSIKLTIKNKSEVILNTCDLSDNQKIKSSEKYKVGSASEKSSVNTKNNPIKVIENVDRNKVKKTVSGNSAVSNIHVSDIKQEVDTKAEHFYTALFSNKKDVQLPQIQLKVEDKPHNEDMKRMADPTNLIEVEQPQKKKKLNLQEYKLRRGASSNNSSATVSPEAIFPDMPSPLHIDRVQKYAVTQTPLATVTPIKEQVNIEAPKKIFDPIREASRKILMNTKKQKAEAMRKRDEDIVMSKIPKVDNLELQPLISDAEMMKIAGMAADLLPVTILSEKKQPPKDYDEIVRVSIGTNTDENVFRRLLVADESIKKKSPTPPIDNNKSTINFKIKKSDHVLKHNVFDPVKSDRSPGEENKHGNEYRMDKARYKDITATLKSVGKQVDTKIISNSLFATIQDTVMKKAPGHMSQSPNEHRAPKPNSPADKRENIKRTRTIIVREYDANADHGEDKIILHLEKKRNKPQSSSITVQTDLALCINPPVLPEHLIPPRQLATPQRKRHDSDMSMSSEGSPVRPRIDSTAVRIEDKSVKQKPEVRRETDRQSAEKRSRSKERYESRYRRSRSPSRGHRRKRSYSRNRSRSRGRFRRYRRSDSPYRRKRRSRSRSPYRPSRRSPSVKRDYRTNRSRSRSTRSRSPMPKKKLSPQYNGNIGLDRKSNKSLTPPIRKPTVSESSESSSSSSSSSSTSSSSSSSSSSGGSRQSRRSVQSRDSFRRDDAYRKTNFQSPYSSEDRESNNAPVEERRIVFVGKLEKDITKASLRSQFCKFGPITEVRLHTKEDGSRYGFVTYKRQRDAWTAVESANTFPQYDVGFGGRRDFCRQSYADLDGLEAKYTESAFHGQPAPPVRRTDDMSFEQMLLDMKKKLNKRKGDKKRNDDSIP